MEPGTPISLETQLDTLKAQAEEINREKDQFRDMLQRAQADLINYKRRSEEERDEQQKYMSSRIILKLLPIMDDLSLAIGHAADSDADSQWLEGIRLIQRKLYFFLESEERHQDRDRRTKSSTRSSMRLWLTRRVTYTGMAR